MTKTSQIIRLHDRTHTLRLYLALRLRSASSGRVKVKGVWIRKPESTDLPVQEVLAQDNVEPIYLIEILENRLERHGAWMGTAVPLTQGTIPCA